MTSHVLLLYVAGGTPTARAAEVNLRRLCETQPDRRVEVTVIDVFEQPEAADLDGVLATPVVVHVGPGPVRRAVGDLSDLALVARVLDLEPTAGEAPAPGVPRGVAGLATGAPITTGRTTRTRGRRGIA